MDEPEPQSFAARFAKPKPAAAPAPPRSPYDQMIARSGHLIHKLKAKDTTGRWAYYFVLIQPARERLFLDAIKGDSTIDLEAFGKVIASCYGEEPSPELRNYLKEKYGFDV